MPEEDLTCPDRESADALAGMASSNAAMTAPRRARLDRGMCEKPVSMWVETGAHACRARCLSPGHGQDEVCGRYAAMGDTSAPNRFGDRPNVQKSAGCACRSAAPLGGGQLALEGGD